MSTKAEAERWGPDPRGVHARHTPRMSEAEIKKWGLHTFTMCDHHAKLPRDEPVDNWATAWHHRVTCEDCLAIVCPADCPCARAHARRGSTPPGMPAPASPRPTVADHLAAHAARLRSPRP